jgi:hypothetical protein
LLKNIDQVGAPWTANMDSNSAILSIPGHLLGPFRWAAQSLATIIQRQPDLLKALFGIDRRRMHMIALGLAHLPDDRAHHLAPILFTAPVRHAVNAVLGRCPAGLAAVLYRLPVAVLSRDGYRQLIDLLDDPASAKVLYHFKDKEIEEWMITVLHDIPAPLRSVFTAVVRHLVVLHDLPAALRWFTARGAAPTFDALVADLAAHRQPAQLVARLNGLITELPLPTCLPDKVIGNAKRIDSRKEICRIAAQFKNCIGRYITQIDDGTSAVYIWSEPGLSAVCHVARHGRLGWALDRPLGPRNADLNDHDCQRITDAFARGGIPEVDIVQTIEAIAYVEFSKRDRWLLQEDRRRYDEQEEIWGD